MKKTIRINLAGLVFNIDEDAYLKLDSYLKAIERKFSGTEDGREIISDIEARIAELLREKAPSENEAVSTHHVDYIVETMGRPNDYDYDYEQTSASVQNYPKAEQLYDKSVSFLKKTLGQGHSKRRLFRDPDNRYLGGVVAGLAAYMGVPVHYARIAVAVLMLLANAPVIFMYIILWVAIPEAKTSAEKLEMRGDEVNLDNIENTIRSEFKTVKNKWNNFQQSQRYKQWLAKLDLVLERTGVFVRSLFKVSGKAVAIVLLAVGLVLLTALVGTLIMGDSLVQLFPNSNIQTLDSDVLLSHFTNSKSAFLIKFGAILAIGMPILLIIYVAFRWLFPFHTKSKVLAALGFSSWVVGIVFLVLGLVTSAPAFSKTSSDKQKYNIAQTYDTLFLTADYLTEARKPNFDENMDFDNLRFVRNNSKTAIYGKVELNILLSNDSLAHVEIYKKAQSKTKEQARELIEKINFEWQQRDSVLIFEPYFTLGHQMWRNQQVEVDLSIPAGKVVFLHNDLQQILRYIEGDEYVAYNEYNRFWYMTPNGLASIKPQENASYNAEIAEKTDSVELENRPDTIQQSLDEIKNKLNEL